MKWDNLSIKQKADIIAMSVKAGLRDLNDIKQNYEESLSGAGRVNNSYANGGAIHISPSKRGTFTAEATKHNMGVQEFASKVLSNKEDYSPTMVKKANFARNASHWHDIGGELEGLEDKIYEANSMGPEVVVTAKAPSAYWDGFNWIGYNSLGQRTTKGDNFRPENANIITNPQDFERARLRQTKQADVNHTHAFANNVRNFMTGITALPMATTLAGPTISGITRGGDAMAAAYHSIDPLKRKLIEGTLNGTFAVEGISNYLSDNGYRKTDKLLSEGKYGQAAKSFLGDVLDVSMALPYVNAAIQEGRNIVPSMEGITNFYRHNIRNPYRRYKKLKTADTRADELIQTNLGENPLLSNINNEIRNLSNKADDIGNASNVLEHRLAETLRGDLGKGLSYHENKKDFSLVGKIGERATPEAARMFLSAHPRLERAGVYYNPTARRYEVSINQSPFDATAQIGRDNIVKTGNITLLDIANNRQRTFFLDPKKIKPNASDSKMALTSDSHPTINYPQGRTLMFNPNPFSEKAEAIPTPELPEGYADLINSNIKEVTENILPGSKIFGSASNVARGNLYHDAHDIDVIMTQKQAMAHPEYRNWSADYGHDNTLVYHHPVAGPLDVNILKEDANGFAIGDRAHELYAQLFPKEYSELMKKRLAKNRYDEWERKPLEKISLDKTPEELLEAYDPVTKSIADAFASGKSKHIGRAHYLLHYGNIEDVKKGFETYANYVTGGNYTPSVPVEAFNDAAKNSEYIDNLGIQGINKEQFINDPERMHLLWEYVTLHDKFLGRGISASTSQVYGNPLLNSLLKWNPNTHGGTAMGVGLNTVVGGDSGYGTIYSSLLPSNMSKVTGRNPEEVLTNLSKFVGGNTPLPQETLVKVEELAAKHKVPIHGSSFSKILDSTSGHVGENYKAFLKDLKENFGLEAITNGTFGTNTPYASSTVDLEPSNIGQIFVGIDRPKNPRAKAQIFGSGDNTSQVREIISDEDELLASRHLDATREMRRYYMMDLRDRLHKVTEEAKDAVLSKRDALVQEQYNIGNNINKRNTHLYNLSNKAAMKRIELYDKEFKALTGASVTAGAGALYYSLKKQEEEKEKRRNRVLKSFE